MPAGIGGEILWLCPSLDDSANDLSGLGNHGTYNGGMGTVSDVSNGGTKAYFLDGINDFIEATSLSSLYGTTGVSFSFWAKLFNASSNVDFGFSQSGLYADVFSFNPVFFQVAPTSAGFANSSLAWRHIALSYAANSVKGYLNGTLVVNTTGPAVFPTFSSNCRIGRYMSATYSKGWVDDARVFNRAITQANIDYLYNAGNGRGRTSSGLILPRGMDGGYSLRNFDGGYSA